jgi:chorismate dehydratase
MWNFEHDPTPEITANFDVEYTVPSKCANALAAGCADIGIIPVFTYAEIPNLVLVPDVAIASRGAVRSILLISKRPLEEVKTVAVDTSSRTSVALTQVILTKWYGGQRQLVPIDPDVNKMLERCDAALLIGDPALVISEKPAVLDNAGGNGELYVSDLAELWVERTGKPFVFAVWAVSEQALRECRPGLDVAGIFQNSRYRGLLPDNVATIGREWSSRLGLSEEAIREYLTQNIYYKLDRTCMDGLETFFEYSRECGLIRTVPQIRFVSL